MGKGSLRRRGDNPKQYRDNYDKIFGKKHKPNKPENRSVEKGTK